MDYFYYINSDVLNIIITYLDYNDIKFIIDHENLIDFHDLFILKFKEYYDQKIKDYNIKNIYLGFLALEHEIVLELFMYQIQNRVPLSIQNNIDVNKYLINNSLVEVDTDYIAQLDNVDIFLFLEDSLNISDLLRSLLNLNSYNILEYILRDKDGKYFDNFNLIDIIEFHYLGRDVETKITKLILKHQPYIGKYILDSIYVTNRNIESFIYIINGNFFEPTENDLTELLNKENESNNVYIKFKMIIEKYYLNDILEEGLFDLYENYNNTNIVLITNYRERMKILAYLANMNMVINTLEIEDDIKELRIKDQQ